MLKSEMRPLVLVFPSPLWGEGRGEVCVLLRRIRPVRRFHFSNSRRNSTANDEALATAGLRIASRAPTVVPSRRSW